MCIYIYIHIYIHKYIILPSSSLKEEKKKNYNSLLSTLFYRINVFLKFRKDII